MERPPTAPRVRCVPCCPPPKLMTGMRETGWCPNCWKCRALDSVGIAAPAPSDARGLRRGDGRGELFLGGSNAAAARGNRASPMLKSWFYEIACTYCTYGIFSALYCTCFRLDLSLRSQWRRKKSEVNIVQNVTCWMLQPFFFLDQYTINMKYTKTILTLREMSHEVFLILNRRHSSNFVDKGRKEAEAQRGKWEGVTEGVGFQGL